MVLASMRDETPVSFLTWKEQWMSLVSSTFHTCYRWVLGGDALGGPTSWAMLRTGNRGQTLWYTNNHNYVKIIILLKCCILRSTAINIFLESKKKNSHHDFTRFLFLSSPNAEEKMLKPRSAWDLSLWYAGRLAMDLFTWEAHLFWKTVERPFDRAKTLSKGCHISPSKTDKTAVGVEMAYV